MEHFGLGSAPWVDRYLLFLHCYGRWKDWGLQPWDEAGNEAFIPRGVEEFPLAAEPWRWAPSSPPPSLQATGNQLNLTGVKLANFFSKP